MKRILAAVIVAILTTIGVVIPINYVDSFVTIFIANADASSMVDPLDKATVEALRPSWSHFRDHRPHSCGVGCHGSFGNHVV